MSKFFKAAPLAALLSPIFIGIPQSLSGQTDWRHDVQFVARWQHATAFDSVSKRVLVFGGELGRNDLWSWDGSSWQHLPARVLPPGRRNAAMAFDPVRQRLVLFGGAGVDGASLGDTWEWTSGVWLRRTPSTSPLPRFGARMVYDPGRQKLLLFGGATPTSNYLTFYNDTWEWDGNNWQVINTPQTPSGRLSHAMSYNPARQRVIVYGGWDAVGDNQTDSWQFDGSTWTPLPGSVRPVLKRGASSWFDPGSQQTMLLGHYSVPRNPISRQELWTLGPQGWSRVNLAMPFQEPIIEVAYDPNRRRAVMLSRYSDDATWEFDGTTWTRFANPPAPGTGYRSPTDLAYDQARGRAVLVTNLTNVVRTWENPGTGWVPAAPATEPHAPEGFRMAYDPGRQRLVLVGASPAARTMETWEYDGSNWQRQAPNTSPPAFADAALVHDPIRGETVLIGAHVYYGDIETWAYRGGNWTKKAPATAMPAREVTRATWHGGRGTIVALGGGNPQFSNYLRSDFWEWNGSTWSQLAATTSIGTISQHEMAYDPLRDRLIVMGGRRLSTYLDDLWEWDGQYWVKRSTPTRPEPTAFFHTCFDAGRARMLFFGWTAYPTWSYGPTYPAEVTSFGAGCAGTQGVPRLAAAAGSQPWLGGNFDLLLDRAPTQASVILKVGLSKSSWSGLTLPFDLSVFGMTNCPLLVSPDVPLPLRADSRGEARQSIYIPLRANLLGAGAYLQAFVADPGANAAGATMSQAVEVRAGGR